MVAGGVQLHRQRELTIVVHSLTQCSTPKSRDWQKYIYMYMYIYNLQIVALKSGFKKRNYNNAPCTGVKDLMYILQSRNMIKK